MSSTLFDYFKDTFAYASLDINIALLQTGVQLDIKVISLTMLSQVLIYSNTYI
jgi:hypothetical protein